MKTRNKVLAGLATVAIIAVGVVVYITQFKDSTKTYSWRYKMTVVVDTPEGEKSGSAVREIVAQVRPYPRDTQRPWRSLVKVKGEAVVVDLGERGMLFALISDKADDEFYQAFPPPAGVSPTTPEGIKYYSGLEIGLKSVIYPGPELKPEMITFGNIDDPTTVGKILIQDFQEVFGRGVRLKEIYLETSDDEITHEIASTISRFGNTAARYDRTRFVRDL